MLLCVWAHFLVPTVYICCVLCTPFHHLSCVYIYMYVVLPFVFNFPCRLYSSSLGYFGLFPGERSYIAIAAWSPAVHSTVKCVEGVTRDRRRQGSANVESNDGALSILFLFQESKKKGKKFRPPRCSTNSIKFQKEKRKKKEKTRPYCGREASQCDWTLRWWYHSYIVASNNNNPVKEKKKKRVRAEAKFIPTSFSR